MSVVMGRLLVYVAMLRQKKGPGKFALWGKTGRERVGEKGGKERGEKGRELEGGQERTGAK